MLFATFGLIKYARSSVLISARSHERQHRSCRVNEHLSKHKTLAHSHHPLVAAAAVDLRVVRRHVRGRKQSFSAGNLAVPPVLVGAIRHRDDVAPPEVQLAGLLRHEIVQRLDENLLRHHVAQLDVLRPRHARRSMVLDQLVQGVELDHPQEEFALRVAQHLEVLDAVGAPGRGDGKISA